MRRFAILVLLVLMFSPVAPVHAQKKKKSDPAAPPPTREQLQKDIRQTPEFDATVFASPPNVSYPTCLCAGPDGSLFVGIDKTGSLGLQKKMGSVVRCIDTKGDGIADKFQTFCEVDHPRGLFFHAGKLIVLNPPYLTAFYDDDGDGKADRSEILVKGISTDMNEKRGADHTTNGFRLGIDGWLYIAVGDFGFTKAVGKDGKSLTMHGGGVVRVRPDGTELEIVSQGQRNIYDVAVSPLLEIFTRDNTNDGDGWDSRLTHVVPLVHFGYPSLFVHFGDEIIQPLADYGGGAATGSLFLSEPNMPAGFGDTLYTVDWGRGSRLSSSAPQERGDLQGQARAEGVRQHPVADRHGRRRLGPDLRIELARRRLQLQQSERRLHRPAHAEELEVRAVSGPGEGERQGTRRTPAVAEPLSPAIRTA